jgi:AraC family transcriptional activator of tynA and feaB
MKRLVVAPGFDGPEAITHLSLERIPPEKRVQAWVESLGQSVGAYRASTVAQRRHWFDISAKAHELGGLIRSRPIRQVYLSKVSANGHSVSLRMREPRESQAHMLCVAQTRGTTTFQSDGDSMTVGAGEIAFFPVRTELKISSPSSFEHCILRSPDDVLWKSAGVLHQESLHLSGRSPLQRLLVHFLEILVNEPVWSSPEADGHLSDAICEFVRFAVKEGDHKSIHGVDSGHPLSMSIFRHIEANLHDRDLSASKIAQALGCSRRTIYRVFDASDGQGRLISRYIWRRRVERCAQTIRSGRDYGTLTELAYSFGFSSSSHFCRLFKKHMGVGPSRYACQQGVKRRRGPA